MIKKIISSLFFILLLSNSVYAQRHGFGLGMILGEPTGISLKNWLGRSTAVDFAIAWSFEGQNSFTIHGDYLSHHFKLTQVESGSLPFYYGIGGSMKFKDDDTRLGARVPLGLNYHFENLTLDLFLEFVPVLLLIPKTDFEINAGIGIRYFFTRK